MAKRLHLETLHELQFVYPSMAAQNIEEDSVKCGDNGFGWTPLKFHNHILEPVHQGRDIDFVGAIRGTHLAGHANPDG